MYVLGSMADSMADSTADSMADSGVDVSSKSRTSTPRSSTPRLARAPASAGGDVSSAAKPFVKWVGGKRQILEHLNKRRPAAFGRYYEAFVGGGALFWHLQPASAVLNDDNYRLVRTYQAIQNDVDGVIERLRTYVYAKDFYYEMRARDIDAEVEDAEVAAWLIYLNQTGFNGLYRVNRSNGFNVPFGRHKNPNICDEPTLRACHHALKDVAIRHGDFGDAVAEAEAGDFVYFDPPYVPLSDTAYFTSYHQNAFGPEQQARLRDVALDLKRRGVHVLLSNSSAPLVRELYNDGFSIAEVSARRYVNSDGGKRGAVTELLMW